MGRAELRRQAKRRKKEQEKISKVLKNAGFPEFQLPPAPLKTTNLSIPEVAKLTGSKIAVLEQWRKEQTEEIRKVCIMEAQEKLDQVENFITLCNIITSLKHWRDSGMPKRQQDIFWSIILRAWQLQKSRISRRPTGSSVKNGELKWNLKPRN